MKSARRREGDQGYYFCQKTTTVNLRIKCKAQSLILFVQTVYITAYTKTANRILVIVHLSNMTVRAAKQVIYKKSQMGKEFSTPKVWYAIFNWSNEVDYDHDQIPYKGTLTQVRFVNIFIC